MRFVDILSENHSTFIQQYSSRLTPSMHHAMNAMLCCKTPTQGLSQWDCGHCQQQIECPLSCGHRSCSQCQQNATQDWLNRQQMKLLPVDYYMATFTLPFELRALAQRHEKVVYNGMFQVTASVLKEFGHNAARTQANVGFTSVLHTHSRRRDYHPHLHIIVPAGRFDSKRRQWRKNNTQYLFNNLNLAKVWRARLLAALTEKGLTLPNQLPPKWRVKCIKVGRGKPALKYLSRYLYRGVLPDKEIVKVTQDEVTFRYKDSNTKQTQIRTLSTLEFLWLIIQHVIPKGFRRVRDYGLLAGANRKKLKEIQHLLAILLGCALPEIDTVRTKAIKLCACCKQPMRFMGIKKSFSFSVPSD